MKYALIGCGRVARSHIKAAKLNNLEIIALCDIEIEKANKLASEFEILGVRIYKDYKEMLRQEKLDFVAIATSSGCHGEIALYCAEKGCNFLVEKPVSMSIEEVDKVIEASKITNVIAGVCHQNRFNIAVQKLKNVIDNGGLGKISHGSVNIRWHRDLSYYNSASWRGKWQSDGGALMNQCIHGIDLLRWLMGDEVVSVYGSARNRLHPYIEAEDIGVAVVNFKNGAVATIEGTVNATKDLEETLTIFGEKGMVRLGGINASTIDIWDFNKTQEADKESEDVIEKIPNIYGNGHISVYRDIIDSITNNHKPYIDLYAGKKALELVLAIYKSQKTGEVVKLPLKNFGSSDMKNSF